MTGLRVPTDHAATQLRDDLETPPELFRPYNLIYRFNLDPAANSRNAMCARYFDREQDGLSQMWAGATVWLHPPHSETAAWIAKARREYQHNQVTVVALVPALTNTDWWHDHVQNRASIRFLRGNPTFRLQRLPLTPAGLEKLKRDGYNIPTVPFAIVVYKPGRTL